MLEEEEAASVEAEWVRRWDDGADVFFTALDVLGDGFRRLTAIALLGYDRCTIQIYNDSR